MNIGLMGGTFNPVHLAHLRIAEEARELCGLQRVLFIPAADPPHKPLAGEVAFAVRCEMVRLAIAGNPVFELSDIEGQRQRQVLFHRYDRHLSTRSVPTTSCSSSSAATRFSRSACGIATPRSSDCAA